MNKLETHYFDCECHADEHTLKFIIDPEDGVLYTSVFLNDWLPWYKRVWRATKYVFGYKCRYGHWDCWILDTSDVERLQSVLAQVAPPTKDHDMLEGFRT